MSNVVFVIKFLPVLFLFVIFNSCATSGVYEKLTSSWTINMEDADITTLKIGRVIADKTGGSASIEAEIIQLLPLLFLENGYMFFEDAKNADFIVDVRATERDYFVGWNNKKSIALEVSLRPNRDRSEAAVETPLAAGRVIARGTEGLSSSKNLTGLLRAAINETVKAAKKIDADIYISAKENTQSVETAQLVFERVSVDENNGYEN
jgi:hypothetical protein